MAKRTGAYRSEKRKKELIRQKKQEEKRLKRFKKDESGQEVETAEQGSPGETQVSCSPEDTVSTPEERTS